ncbi:hypothetical protein EZY14_012870 [Kordia sp. TARA_039_SRF]|nr:hypothetical protein EZY14_012870 [Kordia sp. TARA_039_SRF]
MKYSIILVLLFFSCSLKNIHLKKNHCEQLREIYNSDQDIRELEALNIEHYQDSVLLDKNLNGRFIKDSKMRQLHYYYANLRDLKKSIKQVGTPMNEKFAMQYLKKADSLYKIEVIVDSINQVKLIKFIEKYGYPNQSRFKDSCKGIAMYPLFFHYPHNDKLFNLLDDELEKGRISKEEYDRVTRRRKQYISKRTISNQ